MATENGKPETPKRKDTKPPSTGDDERSTLLGFLDYLRDAIATKLEGAPEPRSAKPGSLREPTCSGWSST